MKSEIPNKLEPSQQHTPKRQVRFDNSDLIKSSFWIGQVFMVIATIVGVFLAAQEGLSQAITFENLHSKEKNFYLQSALADELSDNIKILEDYTTLLQKETPFNLKAHHPIFNRFVWESMKYSPNALETPSQILSAVRRYNNETAALIKKIEERQLGARYGAKQLVAINKSIKEGALQALIVNYTQLHHELTEAGIDVNPL